MTSRFELVRRAEPARFAVGDHVRCMFDAYPPWSDFPRYTQTYTVNRVSVCGRFIGVEELHNVSTPWAAQRFERVEPSTLQPTLVRAMVAVLRERERQDALFGRLGGSVGQDAFQLLAVLTEEVGELAKDINDGAPGARAELTQVAAVALCWLELLEAADAGEANGVAGDYLNA